MRNFAPQVQAFAPQWRQTVQSQSAWRFIRSLGNQGGEAQGMIFQDGAIDGYGKPGRKQQANDHPRAAHEKIAADLAHDLGLPVPPCVLWQYLSAPATGEQFIAISAQPFFPVYKWHDAKKIPASAAKISAGLSQAASAMVAFDTWLDNSDRHNEGNVVVNEDISVAPPVIRGAYIDFANSLSLGWGDNENDAARWSHRRCVKVYPTETPPDLQAMSNMVDMIRTMTVATIHQIVDRIPTNYLSDNRRKVIKKGLEHRQGDLKAIIRTVYAI